jgi:hypothetical protein
LKFDLEYFNDINHFIDEYLYNLYFYWIFLEFFLAASLMDLVDEKYFYIFDTSNTTKYNLVITAAIMLILKKRTKIYNCHAKNGFYFFLSSLFSFGIMYIIFSYFINYINITFDHSPSHKEYLENQVISQYGDEAHTTYKDKDGHEYSIEKKLTKEEISLLENEKSVDIEYTIHQGFFGRKWINKKDIIFKLKKAL